MQASQAEISQSPENLSKVIKQSYAQDPWFHDPLHLGNLAFEDGAHKKGTRILLFESQGNLRRLCNNLHHDYPGHLEEIEPLSK